ncbi:MAG TPA: efflux RND transporter periplasmic adaptor subunit [Acetobacteraceae bacterium]|nr:efflux RND transporter periplasmic adaptor subunit [Acetobacteraceae bacterium]
MPSLLRALAIRSLLLVALVALALPARAKDNAYVPPPPPRVGVAHPLRQEVTPYLEATGSLSAYNQVDLVARVQGFLQEIDYKDGATVKRGDTLFVIEPAPFQAKLEQAQASLASAQAQLTQAAAEYQRQASLGRSDFASQSTVAQARATRDTDQANVQNQQAGVALAGINLAYTRVTAPFDGLVTAHLASVGDLVGVSGPTKLATIVQLNPIYATFNVSEQDVQRIRANLARRGLTLADLGKVPVEIGLMTEEGYPHAGTLDYVAPQVDTSSGTLTARGIFPNADHMLLPGFFVRVRVPLAQQRQDALLVPDRALGTDQSGRYVLVVNQNDVVEQRGVRTGQLVGALRVIEAGLRPDDRVVVSGIQRAIAGEKVAPQPTDLGSGEKS